MQAAITPKYGPADVLQTAEVPRPDVGDGDVLVEVRAAPVTVADQRLRAADFPSFTALPGRMMVGMFKPRHPVQGASFAGRVVAVGAAVTRFKVGDDVFGSADHGAYAEYIAVGQDAPLAHIPAGVTYAQAAAVPYGGITALRFLRDITAVQPGEKVLILGASGGVGRYAVQLAKHLGAEVTAVCSAASFNMVRDLGADHVLDYKTEDFTARSERYDVVFDIAGASTYSRSRPVLNKGGRYMSLFISVGLLFRMLSTRLLGGPKAQFTVALNTPADMADMAQLLAAGVLRPVLGQTFPLAHVAEAHATAATRRNETVLVTPKQAGLQVVEAAA